MSRSNCLHLRSATFVLSYNECGHIFFITSYQLPCCGKNTNFSSGDQCIENSADILFLLLDHENETLLLERNETIEMMLEVVRNINISPCENNIAIIGRMQSENLTCKSGLGAFCFDEYVNITLVEKYFSGNIYLLYMESSVCMYFIFFVQNTRLHLPIDQMKLIHGMSNQHQTLN